MSGTGSGPRNYTFRISAEGMQEFVQELQRVAGGSEAANAAIGRLIQSSPQLANSMLTVEEQMRRAADRAAELGEAQRRAADAGVIAAERTARASESFGALEARTNGARRGINDLRGALELLGSGTAAGSLGTVASFVGNLADLFGTASTAAGQFEGAAALLSSRLVTLAGLVALPVTLQALGLGINSAGEAARTAVGTTDSWRQTLEQINPILAENARLANEAAAAAKRFADQRTVLESGFGVVLERRAAITADIGPGGGLARQIQSAEAALLSASSDITRRGGRDSDLDALMQRRLEAAENALRALQVRRGELVAELNRLSGNGTDSPNREFGTNMARLSGVPNLYLDPAGPELPPGFGERAGRAAPDTFQRDYDRAEDLARRAAERALAEGQRAQERAAAAEQRILDQRVRENERTTDRITGYLADRFTDAFSQTGRGFAGLLDQMRQLAISTPIRIGVEALVKPIVSAGVDAFAGAGGLGGITSALGLSGLGSQISGALGLGGIGGGISGLLSAPLFGEAALASATNSALAGMGGAFGPAAPSALGVGGLTVGGAIGGLGAGFAVGSTIGGFVAQSGAQRTNSQIGAGIGTAAGLALTPILGPLGPIIGGAAGGAIGGMIGPSSSFSGGDAEIGVDPATGRLVLQSMVGKNFDSSALAAQASQQIAATNASLTAAGLRFDPSRAVGGYWARDVARIGGGGSSNPRDLSSALGASGALGLLTSDNANVLRAISGAGSLDQALGAANWVTQVYDALSKIASPADAFAAQLDQINSRFADAIAQAERYGLATDGLREAQAKAVSELQVQQAAQERAKSAPARNLLEELTFGASSALTPEARGFAALSALNTARGGVGGQGGLEEYARVAARTLPVIRDIFGTSERYGSLLADTAGTLRANAPGGDIAGLAAILEASAAGTDRTTEAILAIGGDTNDLLGRLLSEMSALSARIEAIARRTA